MNWERRSPERQTLRIGPDARSPHRRTGLVTTCGLWCPRLSLWGAAIPRQFSAKRSADAVLLQFLFELLFREHALPAALCFLPARCARVPNLAAAENENKGQEQYCDAATRQEEKWRRQRSTIGR